MKNQSLYIMTGLPYAGKSTLSRELAKRFGFKIASVDEVLDEEGYEIEEMTQGDWDYAYSKAYKRLEENLKGGHSVVVDIGNLKRSERDTARGIAERYHIPVKLIYVDTPKKVIRERWIKNEQTQERGQLEEVTLNRAFDMFEESTEDEQPILYNQTMDLDKWIEENI